MGRDEITGAVAGISAMGHMSIAEAARALRTSRMTIARLAEAGELRASKTGEGRTCPIEIDAASVVALITRHTITASAA